MYMRCNLSGGPCAVRRHSPPRLRAGPERGAHTLTIIILSYIYSGKKIIIVS